MCAGYKTITPIQLLNGIAAYSNKYISFKALRVYMACFELQAIREAAKRSNKGKRKRVGEKVCFQRKELIAATGGLYMRSIAQSLSELRNARILEFREEGLNFTETPIESAKSLIAEAIGGRKGTRPIPVPRKLIRYLSKLTKPALFLTISAYILRGLSINRVSGEIKSCGTVKASFISKVFGISLRAVKSARAEMIKLELISKDTGSFQRKLNRDGAYFRLNFNWGKKESRKGKASLTVNNFFTPKSEFAPPKAQDSTEFAPPKKRLKTPYRNKNQKTRSSYPSGFCKAKNGKGTPDIRDVKVEDLTSFGRVESLYFQAVKAGLVDNSEASALNFLGAACRALNVEGDRPKIFMGIVRRKLWHHITNADEDRALSAMRKYRVENPDRFRVFGTTPIAA